MTDSTKKNLEMRVEAENGATLGKTELAKLAKAKGLDAIHDTVHEMARDEARHGKALQDFSRDTSANNSSHKNHTHSRRTSNGVRRVIFI